MPKLKYVPYRKGGFFKMVTESATVRVAENGRLSLPTKQRRLIGLENGGVVVTRVEDGEIRIRPIKSVIEEIQNLASKYISENCVHDFLLYRAEEYKKETDGDKNG